MLERPEQKVKRKQSGDFSRLFLFQKRQRGVKIHSTHAENESQSNKSAGRYLRRQGGGAGAVGGIFVAGGGVFTAAPVGGAALPNGAPLLPNARATVGTFVDLTASLMESCGEIVQFHEFLPK